MVPGSIIPLIDSTWEKLVATGNAMRLDLPHGFAKAVAAAISSERRAPVARTTIACPRRLIEFAVGSKAHLRSIGVLMMAS